MEQSGTETLLVDTEFFFKQWNGLLFPHEPHYILFINVIMNL